ncbi:MAG: transcriptional regulator [Verrucomicrobia bacterium]|nr:transcriptional regulator [Verrucomicrobiota bacterium]
MSLNIMTCVYRLANMPDSILSKLRSVASQHEVLTIAHLLEAGISDQSLTRLVRDGHLTRVRRGIYHHVDSPVTEHHDLIQVIQSAPKAVIVLISALKFHNIGTQQAYQVWIQLPMKARSPKIDWPPIRIVRTRVEVLFTEGVVIHKLSRVDVAITSPERTVVDCFKQRNKLGIDVCNEALRDVIQKDRNSRREIHRLARLTRVSKVMQPYMEAML